MDLGATMAATSHPSAAQRLQQALTTPSSTNKTQAVIPGAQISLLNHLWLLQPHATSGGTLISVADLPPGTIQVQSDTSIVCQVMAGECQLNFADRVGVFAVAPRATLTFDSLVMNNFHSSQSEQAKALTLKPRALAVWPSILVDDGSTVRFTCRTSTRAFSGRTGVCLNVSTARFDVFHRLDSSTAPLPTCHHFAGKTQCQPLLHPTSGSMVKATSSRLKTAACPSKENIGPRLNWSTRLPTPPVCSHVV